MTPPWGERRRGAPSPSGSAAISAGHGQCVSRCGETHSAPLRCSPGCRRTWTARTSPSRPRTTARCCWRSSLLWRIGASRSNRIAIRMFGREGPMGGMSAQRRPGLQPGDTAGGDNEKRIATQHAQRRPGLQPGDTPPDVPLCDRQRGRSTKAGTPTRRHPAWMFLLCRVANVQARSTKAGTPTRRHPASRMSMRSE